jgi:hypothetical protein
VNSRVFPDCRALMNNIVLVTEHLKKKEKDPRRVLTLVPTKDQSPYLLRENGEVWRMYEFVTGSVCLDRAENADDFRQSGAAFGMFQRQLADFPAEKLKEILPGIHDTPARCRALRRAVEEDPLGRAASARAEIDFYLEREASAGFLQDLMLSGALPRRVTHNDTKLNNVMLDERTHAPLCVIDLDTVMPGLVAHDFGDAVRFAANFTEEDSEDTEKTGIDLNIFWAFADGFLSKTANMLTQNEINTLGISGFVLACELATRFLDDYITGDKYFKVKKDNHNVIRTRCQIALAKDMYKKLDAMDAIVHGCAEKYRKQH